MYFLLECLSFCDALNLLILVINVFNHAYICQFIKYFIPSIRTLDPYRVTPTPVNGPIVVAHSQQALDLLDIHPDEVKRKDFAEYFSGNRIIPGAEPAAHCYCGHQFGSFSGQLGDGATMYVCVCIL